MAERILFLDRDGTLIEEPGDFQVDALEKFRLVPGVIPALIELAAHGYRFIVVSNQDGLGTDAFPEEDFRVCQDHMLALFASQGVVFDAFLICPHLPEDGCECRKPRAGLLTRFLAETDVDLDNSAVIGDRETDMQLAEKIGVRGLLLDGEGSLTWPDIVNELCYCERRATCERATRETRIRATVNLDVAQPIRISTGIGFYDHMLEQVAKHGGFSLVLDCDGDLEVDDHHTVEDTAICLGEALRQALGNKLGTARYGFVVPMDESEASASIDLSGRGRIVFNADFARESVGELSTEMVEHFFRSLADSLGAAIHVTVTGQNAHHMVEACFKAVGRALRSAIRRDGTELPSTKGTLS
ncbi:MAG: bifunctional histidinol-phosphatase/imidazoleglycerol-phosphate dehydratase HisB [Woeseiaceae bacterium]|nr:bifunctional histidinol-phosphatase/imidazoleglycerol-phosphate dehydratase HisB [Woeseiaceae bacterium]NIP20336.1 bifunctional histidinol-phosphatase/imidazoleglycerol-phosphate dehydratase HisB [Woeseiaceae bacterium]NIS89226.1 bifunctional histidinol-phosphatase/imidazoleglycerol-phosphate dehydratase HisB [Woeseiaceae bacterium]